MNKDLKNIIVTGGAGYIGSHACKALARSGYTPVTLDNLSRGHEWAVKWGPLETGDILDAERVSQVLEKYQPMAVMHFAALSYVGESVTHPMLYYRNNVIGSHILLERMIHHGVDIFIFSSTCAVYGNPDRVPITETHNKVPINPYGNTKLCVESMLADLSMNKNLKYISLRYFNAAGADPDGETGEEHNPETHLIPLVLQAASGKRQHIEVYGDDYDTPDGTCIRDYIHVTDLADAHIKALEYLLDDNRTAIFNLGIEKGYSVMEIIDHARRVTKEKFSVKIGSRRPGDPPSLVADSSKIKQTLGWQPEFSDLESILSTAWRWESKK